MDSNVNLIKEVIGYTPPMDSIPSSYNHAFDSNGDFEISTSSVELEAFMEERVFADSFEAFFEIEDDV